MVEEHQLISISERCLIDEASMITGLNLRTIQALSSKGIIWGAAKLGRRWTYDRQRLRAWVAAAETAVLTRNAPPARSPTWAPLMSSSDGQNPLRRAIAEKRAARTASVGEAVGKTR